MNADHCQKKFDQYSLWDQFQTVEKKLGEYRFLTDKSLSLKVVIQAMKNALVSRESIQKQIHYKWFCR